MKKFVVKLDLNKKSVPEKIVLGQHVFDSMTGNANFISPFPTLPTLQTATSDLETAADNAVGGGLLLTAIMHQEEHDFDLVITAMGNYVDSVAQGSETIIKSAGMETKKISSPITDLEQVTGADADMGKLSGEINFDWNTVKGSRVYLVFMKLDGELDDQYKLVAWPSASKVTISGLTGGQRYWFKVEAVYSGNRTGAFSDPATAVAAF